MQNLKKRLISLGVASLAAITAGVVASSPAMAASGHVSTYCDAPNVLLDPMTDFYYENRTALSVGDIYQIQGRVPTADNLSYVNVDVYDAATLRFYIHYIHPPVTNYQGWYWKGGGMSFNHVRVKYTWHFRNGATSSCTSSAVFGPF